MIFMASPCKVVLVVDIFDYEVADDDDDMDDDDIDSVTLKSCSCS